MISAQVHGLSLRKIIPEGWITCLKAGNRLVDHIFFTYDDIHPNPALTHDFGPGTLSVPKKIIPEGWK